MRTKINTQYIVRVGLLVAAFVALSVGIHIHLFGHFYVCLGYIAMLVGLVDMGVTAGAVVGTMGVFLHCLMTGGINEMPGWAIGNLVICLLLGWCIKATQAEHAGKVFYYVVNSVVLVDSVIVGIIVCKSYVESMLYGQPLIVRVAENSYTAVADIVVMLVMFPMATELSEAVRKYSFGPMREADDQKKSTEN